MYIDIYVHRCMHIYIYIYISYMYMYIRESGSRCVVHMAYIVDRTLSVPARFPGFGDGLMHPKAYLDGPVSPKQVSHVKPIT